MKILQIVYNLRPGGAERLVVDIANELSRQGHDVTLCVFRDDLVGNNGFYKREVAREINYVNLKIPEGLRFSNIYILYKLIKKLDPQIVHCHLNLVNYIFPLTFRFRTIRFFHTIHSNPSHEVRNVIEYRLRQFFYSIHKVRAITISKETSQSFYNYYKTHPFSEIYNGRNLPVPTTEFEDVKKEIQKLRDEGNTTFVHIGTCNAAKNQVLLINVFNRLIREGENLFLNIIGSGFDSDEGRRLKQLACEKIVFLGEKHNISDYLLNADVFCLSSAREGMPISLIEAYACGCVPVCTPVGGLINIVENGVTGYLSESVSEDDYYLSMRSYLENKGRIRKADMIKYYNSRFSIEECVNKYVSLYVGGKRKELKEIKVEK
jgi:glycosyltransferase involved in cell wall biosynthesis